jgi:hypothetical protein
MKFFWQKTWTPVAEAGLSRRQFVTGPAAVLAAPVVIRSGVLMPVRALVVPEAPRVLGLPRYRLTAPCYLGRGPDATYRDVGYVIDYAETPNLAMEPLNDAAVAALLEYKEMLAATAPRSLSISPRVPAAQTLAERASYEKQAALIAQKPLRYRRGSPWVDGGSDWMACRGALAISAA